MKPCKDDAGNLYPEKTYVCAPNGVVWQCSAGEWVSTGAPCKGNEPRPPLHGVLAAAHNLLRPAMLEAHIQESAADSVEALPGDPIPESLPPTKKSKGNRGKAKPSRKAL